MHGTFWKFPPAFTQQNSARISPRSDYLKVIGDFAEWNGRLVLGCDDSAKAEFLHKREAKGKIPGPQSQSNLWLLDDTAQLDSFGPAIGRGAVWVEEPVKDGVSSNAFLFSGYDHRGLHFAQDSRKAVSVSLEFDRNGNGEWSELRNIEIAASGYAFVSFPADEKSA